MYLLAQQVCLFAEFNFNQQIKFKMMSNDIKQTDRMRKVDLNFICLTNSNFSCSFKGIDASKEHELKSGIKFGIHIQQKYFMFRAYSRYNIVLDDIPVRFNEKTQILITDKNDCKQYRYEILNEIGPSPIEIENIINLTKEQKESDINQYKQEVTDRRRIEFTLNTYEDPSDRENSLKEQQKPNYHFDWKENGDNSTIEDLITLKANNVDDGVNYWTEFTVYTEPYAQNKYLVRINSEKISLPIKAIDQNKGNRTFLIGEDVYKIE